MSRKFTPDERRRLAAKAGISEVYLYQCLSGFRKMNPADAVRVERVTGGKLTRKQLRTDWADIWPDLS